MIRSENREASPPSGNFKLTSGAEDERLKRGDALCERLKELQAGPESVESVEAMRKVLERMSAVFDGTNELVSSDKHTLLQSSNALPLRMGVLPGVVLDGVLHPEGNMALLKNREQPEDSCVLKVLVMEDIDEASLQGKQPAGETFTVRDRGASLLGFTPGGERMYAAAAGELCIYSFDKEKGVELFDTHNFGDFHIGDVRFSADGNTMALRVFDQSWEVTMDLMWPSWSKVIVMTRGDDGKFTQAWEYKEVGQDNKNEAVELVDVLPNGDVRAIVPAHRGAYETEYSVRTLKADNKDSIDRSDRKLGDFPNGASLKLHTEDEKLVVLVSVRDKPPEVRVYTESKGNFTETFRKSYAPESGDPESSECRLSVRGGKIIVEEVPRTLGERIDSDAGKLSAHLFRVLDLETGKETGRIEDVSPNRSPTDSWEHSRTSLDANGCRSLVISPQRARESKDAAQTVIATFAV